MNPLPNPLISLLFILSIHFFSLSSLSHLNEANIEWPLQLDNFSNNCEATQLDPPSSHLGVALNLTTISNLDNYSIPTNNTTSPHDTPQPRDASVNVMRSISHESLRGSTPPPGGSPSIHMVVEEHQLHQSLVVPKDEIIIEGKLRGSTPPSGLTPIDKVHMASLNEEEKHGYVNEHGNLIIDGVTQDRASKSSDYFINIVKSIPHESLKGSTPPPGSPSPIHMAARTSISRDESYPLKDKVNSDGFMNIGLKSIPHESLKGSTPPPGSPSPIHMAAGASISRDESYPLKDKLKGNAVNKQDSLDQHTYSSFSAEDHSLDTRREQENDVPLPIVLHSQSSHGKQYKNMNHIEQLKGVTPPPGSPPSTHRASMKSTSRLQWKSTQPLGKRDEHTYDNSV